MTLQGPLAILQSRFHQPHGLVPPATLVEAAADRGYGLIALGDEATLAGVPSFLQSCQMRGLHPLVGMQVCVLNPRERSDHEPYDVLSLASTHPGPSPTTLYERVLLLATNREGYMNLLRIRNLCRTDPPAERSRSKTALPRGAVLSRDLLAETKGLFLIAGVPGSWLSEVVEGHRHWAEMAWFGKFLAEWPKRRMAFGGLGEAVEGERLAVALDRLKHLPLDFNLPPIAAVFAAYRTETERFWGCAAAQKRSGEKAPVWIPPASVLVNRDRAARHLTGLSRAFRLAESLATKESDLSQRIRCTPPVYPAPRGTDLHSFFWTLVQETAIATGHIRTPGGKERLYEEFQYLKQTPYPLMWILLWDLRRRMGLPPGTFRPDQEWIATSLCAHLLGLCRVDPLRAGIAFQPQSDQKAGELRLRVAAPHGLLERVLAAAEALLGNGRAREVFAPLPLAREDLRPFGNTLLPLWERFEFPGEKPFEPPPFPSYLPTLGVPEEAGHTTLLLSGNPLDQIYPLTGTATLALELGPEEAARSGGLLLELHPTAAQTLASAHSYRPNPDPEPGLTGPYESLSEWIESHIGKVFLGRPYADDSGKFSVLGQSSQLFRLLSLPSSLGYRPLPFWWIRAHSPKTLGELADLMTLGLHWSFWSQRSELRRQAVARPNPLKAVKGPPPWWSEWEAFREESRLDSRLAGKLSSSLEEQVASTGGWLLYREQLEKALEEAWGFTREQRDGWLAFSVETLPIGNQGEGLWRSETRAAFSRFLGRPYPLPSRVSALLKAEQLLCVADAYDKDPAAAVVLLSILYPEEWLERREVYSLIKQRGVQISVPSQDRAAGNDRSLAKNSLWLGYRNIQGVGPQILNLVVESPDVRKAIESAFQESAPEARKSWETLLSCLVRHPMTWQALVHLIRVGAFDHYGLSRSELSAAARGAFHRRLRKSTLVQQTLFAMLEEREQGPPEEEVAWSEASREDLPRVEHELAALHFCPTGSPLERFQGQLPDQWLEGPGPGKMGGPRLLGGWIENVEVYAQTEDSSQLWVACLLHERGRHHRLVDHSGLLAESLREALPKEPRWDGQRTVLRRPFPLLCRVLPHPMISSQSSPCWLVERVEPFARIGEQRESWVKFSVRLRSAEPELLADLESLLGFFTAGSAAWSLPLVFEVSPSLRRAGPVRRLVNRLGERRVVSSRLLVSCLERLDGVEEVRIDLRQNPLNFPSEVDRLP